MKLKIRRSLNVISQMHKLTGVAGMAGAMLLMQPHYAAAESLASFNPPKLDYKAICKDPLKGRPKIDLDWTKWDGKNFKLSLSDATSIASEYGAGSDRVERSPETALVILRAAEKKYPTKANSLDVPIGRALQKISSTAEELRDAETRLLHAYGTGSIRAAFALGQMYGSRGPADLRDSTKAKYYLQKTAAASDPDGLIEYAKLISENPESTPEQKRLAVTDALVVLNKEIKKGNCASMSNIGFMYLHGELVDTDIKTALNWFEEFAKTGDGKTALNISQLYASNRVEQIDIGKSVQYLKQAADAHVPSAEFSLGKAYATGITVDVDLDKAIQYLDAASKAGVGSADEWLARIYSGEFGPKDDKELAIKYFERSLASSTPSADVQVLYSKYLATYGTTEQEVDITIAMLTRAADAGSVDALVALGNVNLKLGEKDPKFYTKAIDFFKSATKFGSNEGASKLASIFSCGKGVPISIPAANEWRQQAAIFGSVRSIYLSGLTLLENDDEAVKNKGRVYIRQAAFKGNSEAIGYSVARWEKGADGFDINPAAAAKLVKFVEGNESLVFRDEASISIIRNRFDVATNQAEIQAQFDAIETYVQKDVLSAYSAKAEMLQRAGQDTPDNLTAIYKILAEKGDQRGMREYGKLLLTDPKIDVSVGQGWLQKASANGDIKAVLLLIDPTSDKALQELEKISSSGRVCTIDHMVNIARVYNAIPDPDAQNLARYWLDLAHTVVGRDADDLFVIGSAYRDGIAGLDERYQAENLFTQSLELGRKSALRDLAEGHLQKWWKDSSPEKAKGYLLKQYALGDKAAGNKFIQEVADKGMTTTVEELLPVLASLDTEIQSPAKNYLKLARMNIAGEMGAVNDSAAIDWLTQSADAGDQNAMYRLYNAYFYGKNAEKNLKSAFEWLEKSATAGNKAAIKQIAVAYQTGVDGLTPDAIKADFWTKKATELTGNQ